MTNKSRNSDSNQEFKVPPAFKFQEGEKVLCFHGPLIYEAKCLQARYDDEEKSNKYHIHYSGWNKSWDEWVPESRVLKHNEGNILRQKELHKAQKAEPKGKKGKKRSVTGKEKEADGKEKDGEDSRSSTPVNEKGGGGKASASATQSSSQESASDIPKRKRSKLDPSVETPKEPALDKKKPALDKKEPELDKKKPALDKKEPALDKKEPPKSPSLWKVNLAKPTKNPKKRPSDGSPGRSSPNKKLSPELQPNKKLPEKKRNAQQKSPLKTGSPKNKTVATSTSPLKGQSLQLDAKIEKSASPVKKAASPKKSVSPKKPLSPSKLYPVLKGKKFSLKVKKLDMATYDENTGRLTPLEESDNDLNLFGAYVAEQLKTIKDKAKVLAIKTKIKTLLSQMNVKANH